MQPDNLSEFYYNKGISAYEAGQYGLAIENFQKAIELDKFNFDYHYNLGVAYIKIEEYDLAINSFNTGLDLNASDYDCYLNLGLAFYNKGEFYKAVNYYNKAVSFKPHDPEGHNSSGIAYCALNNYPEAILKFKKAVRLDSKNSTYNYNLAYAAYEVEKYELALEHLNKVISYSDKQDEELYFLLGKVYFKKYNYRQARENLEKALEFDPEHKDAKELLEELNSKKADDEIIENDLKTEAEKYFNLATELFESKEYEAAIREFRRTLTFVKDHPKAVKMLNKAAQLLNESEEMFEQGAYHFNNNEIPQAIKFLEGALEINPYNEENKNLLDQAIIKNREMSQTYLQSGQYDLALDSLRQKLDVDSDNKETQDALWQVVNKLNTCQDEEIEKNLKLSIIYINKQEYENAYFSLQKVLEIDPNNSEAKTLIEKVLDIIN